MKQALENIKVIIAEVIGIIGGFIWGAKTSWDYEPLLLLAVSFAGFLISLISLIIKKETSPITENLPTEIIHKVTLDDSSVVKLIQKVHEHSEKILIINNISPREIRDRIQAAPLFQQEETANYFNGLTVQWVLRLFIIHKRDNDHIRVVMKSIDDSFYGHVSFSTSIGDYPFFKIAEDGKKFTVTGQILKCEIYNIELQIINLSEI